jgi:hypothetical protein
MGLFPQCVVTKFLDASSEDELKAEAFQLLSAFFESTKAKEIKFPDGSYSTIEAAHRLSGLAIPKPSSDPVFEMMKQVIEAREKVTIQRETIGGAFSICHGKDSQSRWRFSLSRKRIPFFHLYTNVGEGFHPQRRWGEEFFERGVAHVVWQEGVFGLGRRMCCGNNADQYLYWKCQGLLYTPPLSPIPDQETARLSHEFRRTCQLVYEREKMNLGHTSLLAVWPWKTMHSIKAFDKALINVMGLEKLATTLNAMGITVDEWLEQ